MKKWWIAIGVVIVGTTMCLLPWKRTPQYQGRSITEWLDDWAAKKNSKAIEALRHIGNDALPYVVENLARNDSSWRSNYAKIQAKMPAPLQRIFTAPKALLKEVDGANAFYSVGSNSI